MPQFKYKAISGTGKRLDGIQDANSEAEVLVLLREKGYIPIKVFEYMDQDVLRGFGFFQKVKSKDLAIFCRQFYFIINAGVTIINGLDILRKQIENKRLKSILDEMYKDVQKGESLSHSMKKYENVFPRLLIHMVEAGELSGKLDIIMNKMTIHYEKESKIQREVKGAMIYPIILGITSILVLFFLLLFVMPTFITMFESSGVPLPAPTKALIRISNFVRKYWYIIFMTTILLLWLLKIASKSDKGRLTLDTIKTKIPIVNNAIQKIVSSRFASTLSMLLGSGISLIEAIEVASKVVRNKIVENGLQVAGNELERGMELSESLQRINYFPPLVVSTIRVGEYSGTLDEILEQLADFYDSEVESAIQSLVSALEPLMIIIMAILIGAIVIAMVLPMFNMGLAVQ